MCTCVRTISTSPSRDTDVVYQVDPTTNPPTVVRSIPVGHKPFGVAVNNVTGKIYVAELP